MKVENRMRKPIDTDPRGKSAVVDEAADGSKAIPVTFVYKADDGFVHDGTPHSGTEVDNKMRKPVDSDSRGNAEVVDEDVNGVKAIPLVPVAKNESGEFEYIEIGGGGDVTVDWADVKNKPATYPPSDHTHSIVQVDGLQNALDAKLTASKAAAQADSDPADLSELAADFNSLLAKLRAAGIMV